MVFPLALILLISMQGILVFEHHCSRTGDTFFGFYTPLSCKHHDLKSFENTLCSYTNNDSCHNLTKHNHGCCSDKHFFFKTNIPSTVGFAHIFNLTPKCIELDLTPIPYLTDFFSGNSNHIFFRSKPPPKTGFFKVIFTHSLKLPFFLS